jgi:hypothetical protein
MIMAKFELKFQDYEFDELVTIECKLIKENTISIKLNVGKSFNQIRLDKSTAIKFAKTLRTEINKITESEVDNE